jgi:hypothetical protein
MTQHFPFHPWRDVGTAFVVATLALASFLAPAPARANPVGFQTPCPYCSKTQMRSKALQVLPNAPGVFSTHVYSLATNVISNLQVECLTTNGVDPETDKAAGKELGARGDAVQQATCPGQRVLTEVGVDANVKQAFDALRAAWVDTGGRMHKDVTLDVSQIAGQSPTVYDIAGSWQVQQQLGTGVHNWVLSNGGNYFSILGGSLLAWAGFTDGMTVTITLTTSDGGFVVYEWKLGEVQAYYKSGSARTIGGQAVPENAQQADGGIWNQRGPNGNFDDLREFADYLRRRGIPVVRADNTPIGTVVPGPIYKITCTRFIVNGQEMFLCKIQELP